ncbi:MAG: hypothetical protein AB1745_29580 [Pseudomonadota bacterium]
MLIYDMALLGVLALDQGRSISATVLNALLLSNPTDAYRRVDNQLSARDAGDANAARRLRRLHWSVMPG